MTTQHTDGRLAVINDTDIIGTENDPESGWVGTVDVAHVYLRIVPGRTEANALAELAAQPHALEQQLPTYREIEARMEQAIAVRFGITLPGHASIKAADLVALATEKRDLTAPDGEWDCLTHSKPDPLRITPLPPNLAKAWFMGRYLDLVSKWKEAA